MKTTTLTMDNNHTTPMSMLVTLSTTILSWITLINSQYALSFLLTLIGIVSGCMAIRFYYYAGNEKRNKLKKR
jgi:uncharacterized YccA/Bax inhibitor family protein